MRTLELSEKLVKSGQADNKLAPLTRHLRKKPLWQISFGKKEKEKLEKETRQVCCVASLDFYCIFHIQLLFNAKQLKMHRQHLFIFL